MDPDKASVVVRIFTDYAAGLSPDRIAKQLNREGVAPPRSGKRRTSAKPPAWSANTITGNAARGTGLLNNLLYAGLRPFEKQQYRKNPDTGRRHAFITEEEQRPEPVAVPELRIVSDALWQRVKARQESLARGPRSANAPTPLPFFAQQRPKYLLTGKMACGECGASYAKSGQNRFGCQGSAKKGETYCGNRLTIRQDEIDRRVLSGLLTEMMRDDVLAIFIEEYEAEAKRLQASAMTALPERESEYAEISAQIGRLKAAILQGVDPTLFVDELNGLGRRQAQLEEELTQGARVAPMANLLHPSLGRVYREKVSHLTEAYEDEGLRAQAFERIRALIEQVTLTPEDGALAIDLRGELASMLELCACGEMQKAPEEVSSEALQIKMVAGTGFEPVTFRL